MLILRRLLDTRIVSLGCMLADLISVLLSRSLTESLVVKLLVDLELLELVEFLVE